MSKEEQELINHLTQPGATLKVISKHGDKGLVVESQGYKLRLTSPIYDPTVNFILLRGDNE
jgi:hypothetical protein